MDQTKSDSHLSEERPESTTEKTESTELKHSESTKEERPESIKVTFSIGGASNTRAELNPHNSKFLKGNTTSNGNSKLERNYITGIARDGEIIGGKNMETEEELYVIPLEDTWVDRRRRAVQAAMGAAETTVPRAQEGEENENENNTNPDAMEIDSCQPLANSELLSDAELEYLLTLPPMMRNRPPGLDKIADDDEKFKFDVSSRPEGASLEDYERMPTTKFGEAMLRGMGWIPGAPVGLNSHEIVPVRTFVRRPERLGLGATPKEPENKKPKGWIPKPGESRDPKPIMVLPKGKDGRVRHVRTLDEELVPLKQPFYDGAPVFVKKGVHRGMRGTIVEKRNEGTTALVRLANEEKLIIPLDHLRQLDGDNADSDNEEANGSDSRLESRDGELSRRYIEVSDSPPHSKRKREQNHEDDEPSKKRKHKHDRAHRDKRSKDSSKNHTNKSDHVSSSKHTTSSSSDSAPVLLWVCPDIHVKVRNKTLKGGLYYSKRAWVVDILPGNRCTLKLDGTGEMLEDIRQHDLETIVPAEGGHVKVVRGEFKGELGKVHEKEADKDRVHVQLESDLEIVTLGLDDVAQYKGAM